MNIGILTVHGFGFHPNGRLQAAARAAGHRVLLINPYHLVCSLEKKNAPTRGFFLNSVPSRMVSGTGPAGKSDNFLKHGSLCDWPDVVMPRQGSPMGEYGFVVLRQLQAMGILLVNGLEGVTIARHQFITLQTLSAAGIRIPDSCFVTTSDSFFAAVDRLGGYPVIAKQPFGMGGDGVVKIDGKSGAGTCLATMLDPAKGLVVQRFFPPGGRVDARILVIGGRVAGAMQLTPGARDFRTNIHQNGQARSFDPSAQWADMAVSAARACTLDIAGIDMMAGKDGLPHVVEVNYSPGFRGLEAATKKDIAGMIIAHVSTAAGHHAMERRKPL